MYEELPGPRIMHPDWFNPITSSKPTDKKVEKEKLYNVKLLYENYTQEFVVVAYYWIVSSDYKVIHFKLQNGKHKIISPGTGAIIIDEK